jgi:hypothetical protein
MATYYLDYKNGNDNNDGLGWSTTKRTLSALSNLNPGDIIKFAKSPPPVSIGNATWTNLSKAVQLATVQNAIIDQCETTWTAANSNVSCDTITAFHKSGSYSISINIQDGFTTGKVAYKSVNNLDLSNYSKISFWLDVVSTVATGQIFQIKLCSDSSGDTPVKTFNIPAFPVISNWIPLTLSSNEGGSIGSGINSIALYALSDPNALALYLDNIVACTDSGLHLGALISKNNLEQGGDEPWLAIQSIDVSNGIETIYLDQYVSANSTDGQGYYGVTETVPTYIRDTILTDIVSDGSTVIQSLSYSGSSSGYIELQGGYNTTNDTQDGETIFNGQCGNGIGLSINNQNYIKINRLNFVRDYQGLVLNGNYNYIQNLCNCNNNTDTGIILSGNNLIIDYIGNSCNNYFGISISNCSYATITCIKHVNNNSTHNLYLSSIKYSNINEIYQACNNGNLNSNGNNYGIYLVNSSYNTFNLINEINSITSNNLYIDANSNFNLFKSIHSIKASSNVYPIALYSNHNTFYQIDEIANYPIYLKGRENKFWNLTFNNSNYAFYINNTFGTHYFANAKFNNVTNLITGSWPTTYESYIYIHNYQQTANNHLILMLNGQINSTTATIHSATGIAWELKPTGTTRAAQRPVELVIGRFAIQANQPTTISAWFRRTNTAITGRLVCKGRQLAGITDDVIATMSASANTWEQLSITVTPTETGVIEVVAQAFGGTSYSVFVDDVTTS